MKTLVLTMALVLMPFELCAQDSTFCTTSRDGLSTRCHDATTEFGMTCWDGLAGFTCEHYSYPLLAITPSRKDPPPSLDEIVKGLGKLDCRRRSLHETIECRDPAKRKE
jgi:hypothetical protein